MLLPGSQAVRHTTLTRACSSSNLDRATIYAGLAQLVRAPALQAGGHRFESYVLHHFFVLKTCNQVLKYIIIILEMKKIFHFSYTAFNSGESERLRFPV